MADSELTRRIAVAVVGVPVVAAAVFLGGWALAALLSLVALGASLEFFRLARRSGIEPFTGLGALAAVALVLAAAARPAPAAAATALWAITITLLLVSMAAAVRLRGVDARPLEAVAVTGAGALLAGGTLVFALFLRHMDVAAPPGGPGPAWVGTALVGFPLMVVWLNDTGAYLVGRRWGRRKLSPRISPGKTVEGSVAGVLVSLVAGALYAELVLRQGLGLDAGLIAGAVGGVLVGGAGQIGDLAESLFKREAGVKDSGWLLPGHGGVLDRLDALFLGIPLAYIYLAVILDGGVAA